MNHKFEVNIEQILKKYNDNVSVEILSKFIDFNKIITYKKGDFIEAGDKAFLLLSGVIRGYYLDIDGNDVTHTFIFEGVSYGSSFLTTDKPHACNFEAEQECKVVEINKTVLMEELKNNTHLLMGYVNMLEEALKRKIARETSFVTKSATERYLDLKKEYPNIEKMVSQTHIASYLGITTVSLSRIRRTIREEN